MEERERERMVGYWNWWSCAVVGVFVLISLVLVVYRRSGKTRRKKES